jgi:hypothetical protein
MLKLIKDMSSSWQKNKILNVFSLSIGNGKYIVRIKNRFMAANTDNANAI